MSNLTELTYLDLSSNNFIGTIPAFGMAKKLTHIDLSRNKLNGGLASSHFEGLARQTAAHIGADSSREKGWRSKIVDPLLPLIAGLLCWVNVLDVITVHLVDRVLDPSSLDLDTAGTVGKQGWTVWAVQVEHVGVAGDGCAQVCVCGCFPFVLEIGAVDALQAHVCHAAGDL